MGKLFKQMKIEARSLPTKRHCTSKQQREKSNESYADRTATETLMETRPEEKKNMLQKVLSIRIMKVNESEAKGLPWVCLHKLLNENKRQVKHRVASLLSTIDWSKRLAYRTRRRMKTGRSIYDIIYTLIDIYLFKKYMYIYIYVCNYVVYIDSQRKLKQGA